jgi:hypothetical protein
MAYTPPHRRKKATGAAPFSRFFASAHVVNLARRPERLERFARSAKRAGLETWTRFEAVDGAAVAADAAFADAWDATRNAEHDRHVRPGPRLASAGERGCALSKPVSIIPRRASRTRVEDVCRSVSRTCCRNLPIRVEGLLSKLAPTPSTRVEDVNSLRC